MTEPDDATRSADPVDHLPDEDGPALDADEGEPGVEPFAGDDDIASGHLEQG